MSRTEGGRYPEASWVSSREWLSKAQGLLEQAVWDRCKGQTGTGHVGDWVMWETGSRVRLLTGSSKRKALESVEQ